jgi:Tfp pilus assembly protein PilN
MIREQALTQLQTRARSLGVATGIYQAQDVRLNEILARRGLLLPVFEAIHEAAPDGIQLTNIDMAAGGSLKISGKARGADKADEFFRGLAASPLLESVVMPEVVPVEREVQFEIVAMIRDRRGADRRRRL